MISGLDVSSWQGTIDWHAVAASGRAFAFVKATEGTDFTDPFFAGNWQGLRNAGMVRGAYHFARPSQNTPEAEAAHFLAAMDAVGGFQPGDMVALDLEDTDVPAHADLLPWTREWLAAVEAATGVLPLIYSGWWYLEPHGLYARPEILRYPLWLAAWGALRPHPPGGWSEIAIWQYTDQESVPGVNGPCDGDQAESLEALRSLGKPGAAPDTWQTVVDVTGGWARQLASGLTYQEQQQASRELLDVARMLEELRPKA